MTNVETKQYGDGTQATGVAPLPEMSPREQDMLQCLDDIESVMGGRNGPSIRLRALINEQRLQSSAEKL